MKVTTIFLIVLLFITILPIISSSNVNYYYSPECYYCESIISFMEGLKNKYDYHSWNLFDVSKGNYNVRGVPLLIIGGVELSGSNEILEYSELYLNCNPNIQPPTTVCVSGIKYTEATPNHQRPCSASILIGGKQ